MNHRLSPALLALAIAAPHASAASRPTVQNQSGGFVITLGNDTVHVEQFSRTKDKLEGTIVTHAPETRVLNYSMTFAPDGSPLRYDYAMSKPDGTPLRGNGQAGSLVFGGDSLTREVLKDGQMLSEHAASRPGIFPGPNLPYVGTTVLFYEMGFRAMRAKADAQGATVLPQTFMIPGFRQVNGIPIWFIGADSVEMDYFGVARRGFKLDKQGQIIRSDWTNSTYKYVMRRVEKIDVGRIAKAWAAADANGAKMGAMSPQDTMRAKVGSADIMVTYSRPAKRGRVIWGALVPWDKVWRFGADFATHISTTTDLTIGDTPIPAGRYTLWMLPSENGKTMLIVNKQVNIFGTNYNPANDLVRIPMTREMLAAPVERFTVAIDGGRLVAKWDNAAWSAPITGR